MHYLVMVNETAGDAWLTPELVQVRSVGLLNDLVMQRQKIAPATTTAATTCCED